jgi:uncharacterized cupredoxin-like copper-binding protein
MKKAVSVFMIGILPAFALTAGAQSGGHAASQMQSGAGHDTGHMAGASGKAGRAGDPAKVSRTIEIVMDDTLRFTPSEIHVSKGETIRFFVKNMGTMRHEMALGMMDEMKAHAAEMRSMPNMQHVGPNMMTLNPGQRGGMVWQFDAAGTVDFVCLVPGHMEAGMVGKVHVM